MSARGLSAWELYTIYWFFDPIFAHSGHGTCTGPPLRPPRALDFHGFLFTFCEGNIGGSKGGIMSSEGVKFSKRLKLPTDLVHHTHEVWGPCSYKNTPLRRRGPRVLASYCGFSIVRLHFSTLGHFHMTILATKVKFGWETWLFLFIFVLKYAVPRLQAAARTLQLVEIYKICVKFHQTKRIFTVSNQSLIKY